MYLALTDIYFIFPSKFYVFDNYIYHLITWSLILIAILGFFIESNQYNRCHCHLRSSLLYLRCFYDHCCRYPYILLYLPTYLFCLFSFSTSLLFSSYATLLQFLMISYFMPHIQLLVIFASSDIGNTITMTAAMSYV
jgi:hypothetical protein